MFDFQAEQFPFKIACYEGITDPDEINGFIKKEHPPVALVDARQIISLAHIQVAVLNMRSLEARGKMQSKNIYLELLRCLSPDGRLNGALKSIAIQKDTTDVIAITFEDKMPDIPGLGEKIDFDSFIRKQKTDFSLIKKDFKITDEMLENFTCEQVVITTLSVLASDLFRVKQI